MPKKYEEIGDSEAARLFYYFSHAAVKGVGGLIFGYRTEGEANIPQDGPAIVLFNHLKDPDVLFGPSAIPERHATVIGREGIMNRPIQGKLFEWWGARAIHRVSTDEMDRQAYEEAYQIMKEPLDEGRIEVIFGSPPTRTPGKKPSRPIGIISRLARETGVPVIPAVVKGTDRLFKNWGVVTKFGGAMYHPGGKSYDREYKKRIHIAQSWLFDSISYGYEYEEPDKKIVLSRDA